MFSTLGLDFRHAIQSGRTVIMSLMRGGDMAVALDYNDVVGVSEKEFRARAACVAPDFVLDRNVWTKSDEEDIAAIERLLDVTPGTLSRDDDYLVARVDCECGRLLTTYDFVFTGLVDAGHAKSLILHTFVGSKFVLQQPRPIRCSSCGRMSRAAEAY